jgi:hypothetical protein
VAPRWWLGGGLREADKRKAGSACDVYYMCPGVAALGEVRSDGECFRLCVAFGSSPSAVVSAGSNYKVLCVFRVAHFLFFLELWVARDSYYAHI